MRRKLGEWILDVAKYLVTVGMIAPMLKWEDKIDLLQYYILMGGFVAVMVSVGFCLYGHDKESKNNNKNKGKR